MVELQAGDESSSQPAEAMELFVSYHDLFDQLERVYQVRPPDQFQTLLQARLPKFRSCGARFPGKKDAGRAALQQDSVQIDGISVSITEAQRDLAFTISDRFDLDEKDAYILLRTFLNSEHRSLHSLARKDQGEVQEFLDAFTVFFFEEQLAVIRCISALLRISEDTHNALYQVSLDILDKLADEQFATQLLHWFEEETQAEIPSKISNDPRYSSLWARQALCKQLALLEVVFLMYYGRLQPTCAFLQTMLMTIKKTQFGQIQAAAGFLSIESTLLVDCVAHQLLFLAMECLNLEDVLDPFDPDAHHEHDPALAPYLANPQGIDPLLEILDGAGSLVWYSPILLGFALVLRRMEERLEYIPDDQLAKAIAVHDQGPPMWRRLAQGAMDPSMELFGVMHAMLASPLLGRKQSAVLGASDLSALAYRAVFKGILLSITELVQPEYLPNFDVLVYLYAATFGAGQNELATDAAEGIASLCLQYWTSDILHPTRASTLTTARRRFPASFRPLVQMAYALSGNATQDSLNDSPSDAIVAETSAAAMDYLAELPTLALILPSSGASGLAPYEILSSSELDGVQYRLRRPLPVACTDVVLPVGTHGTLISPLESSPNIVLWHLPRPVSAWQIFKDVLQMYVMTSAAKPSQKSFADASWDALPAPPMHLSALSPDCVDNDWDLVADIAESFCAVMGADHGLAAALVAHLDETQSDDQQYPTPKPSLVVIAIHMLHTGLALPVIPKRMVCAAYRMLRLLLPLDPNEVWQRIRSSNLLIGSAKSLSLRLADEALQCTTFHWSSLLAAEVKSCEFNGLLSLLDLVSAMVDEYHGALYTDTPDLLTIKSQILTRVMHWIVDAIWLEYQSWEYAAVRDKSEIGLRCAGIFTKLCQESSDASRKAPLSLLTDDLFGSQCPESRLGPLVMTFALGHQQISALYTAGHTYDARLAEENISSHLQFAIALLQRQIRSLLRGDLQQESRTIPSTFSKLFFRKAQVAFSNESRERRTFASLLTQYIYAPMPVNVSCMAADLITTLCTPSLYGSESRFSFAASMGSTYQLEHCVSQWRKILQNTQSDIYLRVAIWRLLSALADSQPALATLFYTGTHHTGPLPHSDTQHTPDLNHKKADATVLNTAVQLAMDCQQLWDDSPILLDAVLQFLNTASAHASEHVGSVRSIHANRSLNEKLLKIVMLPTESVPSTPASQAAVTEAPISLAHAEEEVCSYAYQVRSQARILLLFQSVAQQSSKSDSASMLPSLLADHDTFVTLITNAFKDPDEVPHVLEEHLMALVPNVPLSELRKPVHCDAFDPNRVYGTSYVFDQSAYVAKLQSDPADIRHDASVLIASVSLAWSILDAQAVRQAAWVDYLGSSAGRLGGSESSAMSSASESKTDVSKTLLDTVQEILTQAANVASDAPAATLVVRMQLASILLAAAYTNGKRHNLPGALEKVAAVYEQPAYTQQLASLMAPLAELGLTASNAVRQMARSNEAIPALFHAVLQRTIDRLTALVQSVALYKPSSSDAALADAEMQVLVAAMQQIVQLPNLTNTWVELLRGSQLLMGCADLITRAPAVPNSGSAWALPYVLYLDPVLQLCASLAAQPASCELVAQSGIVLALLNNCLSTQLEQGSLTATLPSGDANPLHSHWLLMLQIVTSLAITLPKTYDVVGAHFVASDATAFVQLYASQLRGTWSFSLPEPSTSLSSAPALDVAQLHEYLGVLRMFYAMNRAKARSYMLPLQDELRSRLPWLLHQLAYLYMHPNELCILLGLDNIYQSNGADSNTNSSQPGSASESQGGSMLGIAKCILFDAIATLLALLWDLSQAAVVLSEDFEVWPSLPALISPTLRSLPSEPASLGTLLELASTLTEVARSSKHDSSRHGQIINAFVQSIGLCATQAVLWARGSLPWDASEEHRASVTSAQTEIAAGLGRDVDAAIRAASEVCKQKEAPLLDALRRFSKQYLGPARSD
ncbi:hypothetical protein MYAM1_002573 [Malassezia yamatoensis]|uniref:Nucleoporin Nup188 N-terminal subdomain III domain-containing protein n=1 Tax=Malassezia yamatoensis TaxID=253288 RepID=A0AAJ5YU64_9BASI|nr:hypothetical protein MYAM1_002573 [Malassezia yamatoensis]